MRPRRQHRARVEEDVPEARWRIEVDVRLRTAVDREPSDPAVTRGRTVELDLRPGERERDRVVRRVTVAGGAVVGAGAVAVVAPPALEIVPAARASVRAGADRHPPRWRGGESEEEIRAVRLRRLRKPALVRVDRPVPGALAWLVGGQRRAGSLCAAADRLPARVLAAADLVAHDVEAEAARRREEQVCDRGPVRIGPPPTTFAPHESAVPHPSKLATLIVSGSTLLARPSPAVQRS